MISTTKDTKSTKMDFDPLSNRVIGAALEVHKNLGPGLLETAYEQALAYELSGLKVGLLINFNVPLLKHGIKRLVL
jgi:hypothetical protein